MLRTILILVVSFFMSAVLYAQNKPSLTKLTEVKVQLQWKYQFQFAGFIMAKELGYYKDAGLDVKLLEYNGGDIKKSIKDKKVDYFLQNSALLFDKSNKLMDVQLLATYFQRSPLVLVTQPEIKHISDLKGKNIMTGGNEIYETSLNILLRYYNINAATSKFLHHSFNLQDFIDKHVDAMSVFRTDQVYELEQKRVPFNTIDSAEYGFVTNANNLFTSREYAQNHKKELDAFLSATQKGWEYALSHIQESAKLIYKKYTQRKSIDSLIYEGETTKDLMLQNLYEIGEINVKNLTLIYEEYLKSKGMTIPKEALNKYIYNKNAKESLFTQAQQNYLQKKKKITICVDPKWRPYEWIDEEGKYQGIGADYFRLFAKTVPLQIELYKTDNWSQTMAAIKSKKCDLLPMAGITQERKKFLNFTQPYYFAPYVVATTIDKSFVEDFRDKLDKKYAVITHSAVIDDLQRLYGNIDIVEVDTVKEGLQLVSEGEVFGFINTAKVISFFIQENSLENIKIDAKLPSGYHLAIATNKDEAMLRDIFDIAIKNVNEQELENIKNRWYSVVLETRKDYAFIYKIIAFFTLVFLALVYRAVVLRKANLELEEKVQEKTLALQTLNTKLENKVEQRTKELEHQAYYDVLTNLPNRLLFQDRLHIAIEKAKRNENLVALYFIDLDLFKQINDSLGHHIGDEVLKIVATRLSKIVRKEDTLARLGGDEFTLLVESADNLQECISVAQKMLSISKNPINIENHTLYISLSIGISLSPQDALNAMDLLKNADAAMYRAKEEGRNNFQFYSPEMSKMAYEKVVMQSRLRQAIHRDEFEVYYQPQIDVVNHKVVGFEALVRWMDPQRGVITPDEFLGVAQETGLIVEIDEIVLRKAIKQFSIWHKEALCDGRISLNIAAKELSSDEHLDTLAKELEKNNLESKCLELEITESDIMRNPESAIIKLQKLHALGIKISIDDFGTGYSSLAYLKRFPIDKLKIDQSFVRDIPEDEEDCAIVKAVIALGENLGLTLIAEGVQTKEQEKFLVENGCTLIQGYLYAKPMSATDTELFLEQFK